MGYAHVSISILAGYRALKVIPFLMHGVEDDLIPKPLSLSVVSNKSGLFIQSNRSAATRYYLCGPTLCKVGPVEGE